MSLIMCFDVSEKYADIFCPGCGVIVGREEKSVISDMVLRDCYPLCFDCSPVCADLLPAHLYYLDGAFMLGLGDTIFLAQWVTDGIEIYADDLSLSKISHTTWQQLKTGKVGVITVKPSLV